MGLALGLGIAQMGLNYAPSVVNLVEQLFHHKASGGTPEQDAALSAAKKEAALRLAQTGLTMALGIDPAAFGDPEKALVTAVNDAVVAYYNAKGWPTT